MDERMNIFTVLGESSEMWGSLRYEDMRGCPYHLFDARSIATLATASTLLALISLLPV